MSSRSAVSQMTGLQASAAAGGGRHAKTTGRATIKDVARAAGVSVTTVSHVFNETRPVAPETERRVRAAIEELGYHPSSLARALRGERTGTIGMLVTSSTNPFFAQVIKGVEEQCFERGYSLVLGNTGDDRSRLAAHLSTLLEKRIDGLVVLTTNAEPRFFDDLQALRSLPLVAIDTDEREGVTVVNDDSRLGGALAAEHLLSRGFRRIGVLAGPEAHPRAKRRLQGFAEALKKAGAPLDKALLQRCDMSLSGGDRAMRQLLASQPEPPEAIFCMNDLVAIGALHALDEAGIEVPGQVSLIGYDDIEMAAYCRPPLTTVRQPTGDMGRRAADSLIGQIEKGLHEGDAITLAPKLIERRSVARGPAA